MFDPGFLAVHINLAGCDTADTENTFHQLGSLCTYQSTKSKDLTFSQFKAYMLE